MDELYWEAQWLIGELHEEGVKYGLLAFECALVDFLLRLER